MTTATAPTTGEWIRAALAAQWDAWSDHYSVNPAEGVIHGVFDGVATPLIASAGWTLESNGGSAWEPLNAPHGAELAIWRDLRPSEAVRLMELLRVAQERATARCRAAILEELAAAGDTFAGEHPDAPRNGW